MWARKKRAINWDGNLALYGMLRGRRNEAIVFLSAEPVGILYLQSQHRPDFMLDVHAVRAARFQRHDLDFLRMRAVNRGNAPAGQGVERVK